MLSVFVTQLLPEGIAMVYGREFVCVARDASELWELNMRLGAQANHQIM